MLQEGVEFGDDAVGFWKVFSTVDLKAQREEVDQRLNGDWGVVSLVMMGACLSSREDRVVM